MKTSIVILYILLAVVVFFPAQDIYSENNKIETLEELIDEALNNNPSVRQAYTIWRAAEYRIPQSMSLPDPLARYTFFGESVETRVGPQEYKIGASQKIPFPVKLALKGKSEARRASILKEKYEAERRRIIEQIKFAYYDIFWVDKALSITEEQKSIVENLEKVAQKRYEFNIAPLQDVLKAQIEFSKLVDRLVLLKQNRKSLKSKMVSILNRPSSVFNDVESVEPIEFNYKLEQLHSIASESKQELLAAKLDIQRAAYERSLAAFDYLPDVTLGFEYINVGKGYTTQPNDGQDAWMGSVAINVPIWFNRLDANLKEKKSYLEASMKRYDNISNRVYYEVDDMHFKILAYKDIISLYKTALLPQTKQGFEAARTGYETGKVDFLNWLDSERVLLRTRLAYYKAIVDYMKSIAYLERIVGTNL
ncbi:MAG: TolC family protein [Candidatus Omnitrophica bacterium]|nr:TolC family protein [Candidatus Omnitrophota bacterium]